MATKTSFQPGEREESSLKDFYYFLLPFNLRFGELLQDINTQGENSQRATSPEANHLRHPANSHVC